jgi:hypothetical protein
VTLCSVRRILIPCRALGLLHKFLLPSGRPRLGVVGVRLGIWLLAGIEGGDIVVGALAFGCSIRLHAAAGSSYCAWSGDVEIMASFTWLGSVYTTRCCWGWPAVRVVRRGSSCLIGSTRRIEKEKRNHSKKRKHDTKALHSSQALVFSIIPLLGPSGS